MNLLFRAIITAVNLLFRAFRDIIAATEHTVFCQEAVSDHVEEKDIEPVERLEGKIKWIDSAAH